MGDIVSILKKRVSDRTYEENIALSFSGDIAGWVGEETKVNPQETELLTIFRGLKKNEKDLVMRMMAGLSSSKR